MLWAKKRIPQTSQQLFLGDRRHRHVSITAISSFQASGHKPRKPPFDRH